MQHDLAAPFGGARARRALLLVLFLLAVALRLPGVGSAPIDGHHVRQADTASMARVMAREGVSLWTPRIGWAGPAAGAVEAEFPIYPAMVGAGWGLLGAQPPWLPRALSVLAWIVGGLALWRIVRRRFPGMPSALLVGLYALSPLAVLVSRSIQPDALAVALLVLAWERADAARDAERPTARLLLAGALLGVAIAAKGPVALWLPVVAFAAWSALERVPSRVALAALGLAVGLPAVWYVHAHQLGADGASFKLWGSDSGKWSSLGALSQPALWRAALAALLSQTLTPLGVGLVAAGAVGARANDELRPPLLGVVAGGTALVLLLPAIAVHDYYLLPLVPFASVVAGAGAVWLWREAALGGTPAARVVGAVVLGGLLVSTGQRSVRYLLWGGAPDARIVAVAEAAREVLPAGTATVVVDRHPQTLLYALDQRGWHRATVTAASVQELRTWGAEAMLITDTSSAYADEDFVLALLAAHPMVARGDGWTVVRLDVSQ
ncbi:MAG: glycosyltransferase family 39 protein [Deltaproteobacteria bacterium]|nr:glycosyltransferase family 39 protein [Deltaproteobacteria bacterium]